MGIWRLGYVEVRSLDLERDLRFWRDAVGLIETGREDGRAYFKCWDEQDHHCWTADQLARSVFLYEKNMPEAFMQCS